jgi:hypothetical protein
MLRSVQTCSPLDPPRLPEGSLATSLVSGMHPPLRAIARLDHANVRNLDAVAGQFTRQLHHMPAVLL